ncbi:hypothetical protein MLD38_017756 [Melastoma candidum]|uniref:Uncharacterized protein n=1 Tax=Melastoma candidum TaxID=119954 RepID=A0ACB9QRM6_9MYRT|nr:hypothetical protein MLD38_017756 [Melastoma candidum]
MASSRRLRAFKRWMSSSSVLYSPDALLFTDDPDRGISAFALRDLREGEVVASIPKSSCLSVITSGAREIVRQAGLEGILALSVTLMYEISLGEESPWAGYLQLLPPAECLPLLWSVPEIDRLLLGTELHSTVKEDKAHIYNDWKEFILPLVDSQSSKLKPEFFGIDQYLAARSLIASRSFQIDKHHGSGMVPLADLFNHKTGAEDVHFTTSSDSEDSDEDSNGSVVEDGPPFPDVTGSTVDDDKTEILAPLEEDSPVLEMILVKDVQAGNEVFNTYGTLGNAALLHRYGFTEEGNPFDLVNIDVELVLQWSSSAFSNRHSRARLSSWRRLGYSGCVSQGSEYFEVSYDGEPQFELVVLLYVILLQEDAHRALDLAIATGQHSALSRALQKTLEQEDELPGKTTDNEDQFLTEGVCDALLALTGIRDSLYGPNSLEDDVEALRGCCPVRERKEYHSLALRVSERRILDRLRRYAAAAAAAEELRCRGNSRRRKQPRKG